MLKKNLKKKIIFLDIGTHKAQEYSALFEMTYLWIIAKFILYRIKSWLSKNNLHKPNFPDLCDLLKNQKYIKKNRHQFFYIFIEPNLALFNEPIYKKSDLSLNFAVSSNKEKMSIEKLYIANNDFLGQGSSLFKNKPNIDQQKSMLVVNIDANALALAIKKRVVPEMGLDYKLILRINNEGAESDLIYALKTVFKKKLSLVLGSLKDTKVIKGETAFIELNKFMHKNHITFIEFNSSIKSWKIPMQEIRKYLGKTA